jgi:hypothetical protein
MSMGLYAASFGIATGGSFAMTPLLVRPISDAGSARVRSSDI